MRCWPVALPSVAVPEIGLWRKKGQRSEFGWEQIHSKYMMTAEARAVGLSHYQVLPYQRLACDARKGSALFPGWSKFSQKIWWQRWHEVLACRTTKCCRTRDWPVVQKKAALCIRDGANSFKIQYMYDDSGGMRCFPVALYQVLPCQRLAGFVSAVEKIIAKSNR